MVKPLFRKGPRLPSLHACRRYCDPVDPPSTIRDVTAYFLKTLPPEKLASAGDVVLTLETIPRSVVTVILGKRRPGDAQSRIFCKFSDQKAQVFRVERKVGIEVSDHVELKRSNPLQACIESVNFSSKTSITLDRSSEEFDPWIAARITFDDLRCSVGRTIVHYHPSLRQPRLRNHGREGLFNERFFIMRGGD
jgi:hypothetical protein